MTDLLGKFGVLTKTPREVHTLKAKVLNIFFKSCKNPIFNEHLALHILTFVLTYIRAFGKKLSRCGNISFTHSLNHSGSRIPFRVTSYAPKTNFDYHLALQARYLGPILCLLRAEKGVS